SVVKSFFLGNILEENLFPFPSLDKDEAETIRIVQDSIDKFMQQKEKDLIGYDINGSQPAEYIELLKELGLFGLIIGEEYGGIGLSNSGYSRILQQVAKHGASTSLTIGAHSSIGLKGLLLFGTVGQKEK